MNNNLAWKIDSIQGRHGVMFNKTVENALSFNLSIVNDGSNDLDIYYYFSKFIKPEDYGYMPPPMSDGAWRTDITYTIFNDVLQP